LRPTAEEIDNIEKNPDILINYGWERILIFQMYYAWIPPYIAASTKKNDLINRTIAEKQNLTENVDYFTFIDAIKLHLKRYGYGNECRPMLATELKISLQGWWQFLYNKTNTLTPTPTYWLRNGVETPKELTPEKRGIDYFLEIEEIADYFESQKELPENERSLILPVVAEY